MQTIRAIDKLHALESLQVFDCPELEELSFSALQTCIEKISIVRCGKLRNIALPITVVELRIEGCRELKTVAVVCFHTKPPNEFSNVAHHTRLNQITIHACDKLQSIQGIDELHALKCMQLSYSSNGTIQNCIPILKSMPSELVVVIGRAADGALSTLSPDPFSDAEAFSPVISESDGRTLLLSKLSAVIFCYVVVIHGDRSVRMLNHCLANLSWSNGDPPVEMISKGESVITVAITNPHKLSLQYRRRQLEDVLVEEGILVKKYRVAIRNAKWLRTQCVLQRIIDTLCV